MTLTRNEKKLKEAKDDYIAIIGPEMVTITKSEYDLLIEIKNKFLKS
ncbi:Uncharacterised protein [Streptococcus equi subsp. zooepidemicus]|uniref:Uncharacterized protein n=1 Tax=Streptococcus equi subsp. zooepidemicus TaxID=40041 RepID=A0A7Z9D2W3_STRSZ|nr:hypothetical protein LJFMMFNO_00955 [Streptococcus equi subsp. zooepidemicus]VEF06773.1 Uncharacterised protein [Streptococcus equi subsp. zooepidemicus]VTS23056.1 Uncharacterised protein [Streptococcus equi subsp. zooepidemicus]